MDILTTSTYIQIIILIICEILKQLIIPIYIGISIWINPINRVLYFLCFIIRRQQRIVIKLRLIIQLHVSDTIHCLGNFSRCRKTWFMTERNTRFSFLPFLRSHHDNTICSFWPIKSSRSCILQYWKLFYIIRLYTG